MLPGWSDLPAYVRRGFFNLPNPKSETQTLLLQKWLDDCDKNHQCMLKRAHKWRQPTRLVDVGDGTPGSIKLDCDPLARGVQEYIALSHRWGQDEKKPPLIATSKNHEALQKSIPYEDLVKNFQDAVNLTRRLKVKYLWIDSLCIIQGEDGDFKTESKFMEDYYSGAYCTIAASCSGGGRSDGFIKKRPSTGIAARTSRAFKLTKDGPKFYISNAIDDFAGDVEPSDLNKRGWVFQERALSRRIIHFTSTQIYWECGDGVRCETMTKLFK